MPSLNRVRAIASFNNGKQCFEDLKINSLGEDIVLDMVNGGGKSFLIQCIGQTIIPNSTWQKDWDFKAVFEPANKNKVVHCLTEWKLDEGMGYKYLLAGFCAARPTKVTNNEGESNYGDFERFSYICLYNEPNDNDIFNLPLTEKDEEGTVYRMSLHDLKRYLKNQKNNDYYVEIEEKARTYKKRLAKYNITNAEWELIRGINADEKYVATYLRSYPTSEKFILKFLIPKIEECNANMEDIDYRGSEALAADLLNIRELMNDLIKKKSQAKEYYKIVNFIELVSRELTVIKDKYKERDALYKEIKKTIKYLDSKVEELRKQQVEVEGNLKKEEKNLRDNEIRLNALEIYSVEKDLLENQKLEQSKSKKVESLNNVVKIESKKLAIKKKENTYLSMLQDEAAKARYIKEKEVIELSNKDLINGRKELGQKVKNYLYNKINSLEEEKKELNKKQDSLAEEIKNTTDKIIALKSSIMSSNKDLERYAEEEKNIKINMQISDFEIIENTTKDKKAKVLIEAELEKSITKKKHLESEQNKLQKDVMNALTVINELKVSKMELEQELKEKNSKLLGARESYGIIEEQMEKYDAFTIEELNKSIEEEAERLLLKQREIDLKIMDIKEMLKNIESNSIALSNDTKIIFNILKEKYPDSILGKDFLENLSLSEKKEYISSNELLPYSILLNSDDYKQFIKDKTILQNYFGSPVPIIDKDSLKNVVLMPQGITFTNKDVSFFVDEDERERTRILKEEELIDLRTFKDSLEKSITKIGEISRIIKEFKGKDYVEILASEVGKLESEVFKKENLIIENNDLKTFIDENIIKNNAEIKSLENNIDLFKKQVIKLERYIDLDNRFIKLKENINVAESEKKTASENLDIEEGLLVTFNHKQNLNKDRYEKVEKSLYTLKGEFEKIDYVKVNDDSIISEEEYIKLSGELKAVTEKLNGVNSNFKKLEEDILACNKRIERARADIEQEGVRIDELKHVTLDFAENSKEVIEEMQINLNKLIHELEEEKESLEEYKRTIRSLNDKFQDKTEELKKQDLISYSQVKGQIEKFVQGEDIKEKLKEINEIIQISKVKLNELKERRYKILNELDKNKDIKSEFLYLEKDIDADIFINKEPLEKIREFKEVQGEVALIKHSISTKKISYNNKLKEGEKLIEYMNDFKEILEELRNLPNNIDDLTNIIKTLVGAEDNDEESILNLVKQEQSTLDDNIKSLEVQEDKFVTLCIQQSENILRDIKKLANLSVIDINGSRQEMIRVNLSELEDDIVKEKMKNYIENLINKSVKCEDENERRLELAKGLTVESLFKQIIKPIKASSIQIYKLEDINNMELNSWLSWDRAYGSKGQTNGMYISVLICLISYLRKLYTTSTDNTKKVIILDNPFSGTTSEIIWLPILKLLKENNVQLWAFGYEIKTQLSNCFNVRYLLEKKPGKGHENIIVSSFKSTADTDNLGYDPLTGKKIEVLQESLF